jgi:uncharacterized protein
MVERDPTFVGRVQQVIGSQVTVALDRSLAGVAPIYRGKLQAIGQIGSLVRIPQGLVDLIGTVSLLGIAELAGSQPPAETVQTGDRWLQIQLLGEVDRATERFQRGVGSYPGLDDPVHFATADDLATVFPPAGELHVRVGRLAATEDVPVCLDAARFVLRHGAVVGSTGAGKTSAVSTLLQSFASGGWGGAHIVVIDPHGEYSRALGDYASVRSVLGDDAHRLRVPYWALGASDILMIFTGSPAGGTAVKRFGELVAEKRREFVASCNWLDIDAEAVTSDTPVPFDLRQVWHRLEYENSETRQDRQDPATACVLDPGDQQALRAPSFANYGAGNQPPHQSPVYGTYGRVPELLRSGLLDPRLKFFQEPEAAADGNDPLVETMQDWLGGTKPISVLDFSGVPSEASELAIGVVLNLIFEIAVRTAPNGPGIGRPSPVLVVLEEAHRYLSDSSAAISRASANRIAREGRKYGVGLLLVTQRPAELPDTALAQCGTLLALRLSNAADQGKIKNALPDSVSGLAAALPSLRTGEALVSGEACILPARILIDRPDPAPFADDPSLESWRTAAALPDLAPALSAWRGIYNADDA